MVQIAAECSSKTTGEDRVLGATAKEDEAMLQTEAKKEVTLDRELLLVVRNVVVAPLMDQTKVEERLCQVIR